jgi:hypothetical protein
LAIERHHGKTGELIGLAACAAVGLALAGLAPDVRAQSPTQEEVPTLEAIVVVPSETYWEAVRKQALEHAPGEDWILEPWEPWWSEPVYVFAGRGAGGALADLPPAVTLVPAALIDDYVVGAGPEWAGGGSGTGGTAMGSGGGVSVRWFGYSQITVEKYREDGASKDQVVGDGDGLRFGADRIRVGYEARFGESVYSRLMVDFNEDHETDQLPAIIQDALVGYDFGALRWQVGQFKTPLGMDFSRSGAELDITKRGLEKGLVLERALGTMVSADGPGFGVDAGVFNPAERSGAVKAGVVGEDYAYAGRLRLDPASWLHAEVAYGASQVDADTVTADSGTQWPAAAYRVWDAGLAVTPGGGVTLKAEYIAGSNIKNRDGDDETVWYGHAGWRFAPRWEAVVRHYEAEADINALPVGGGPNAGQNRVGETSLSNTFLGVNFFLNPDRPREARLQLNYVVVQGDDGWRVRPSDGSTRPRFGGLKKEFWTTDDAWLLQAQTAF